MSRYHDVYAAWQRDPEAFWAEAASAIDWFRPWDAVLSRRDGLDRWFAGALCNTAWNCLDRHVAAGHGERLALIYDSPVTGTKRRYNYRALLDEVETFAAVLADLGAGTGDRVLIYMPMVPEAVIAMLAAARLGVVDAARELLGGEAAEHHRMHRADPRAGQHREDSLGHIGHVDDHAIAARHIQLLQDRRECVDLAVQLGVGDFAGNVGFG